MPAESSRTSGMVKRDHHSFWNWVSMLFWVTTRMRRPRPRMSSSVASMAASRVLPSPTPSAIRMRVRTCLSPFSAGTRW